MSRVSVGVFVLALLGAIAVGPSLTAEASDQHERHAVIAPEPTVEEIIRTEAERRGVDGDALVRLGLCESTLRPWAVGDHGTSFGLFQLSSLPTGLWHHFIAVGYTDAFDAEQSASYVSRVASGEFLRDGTPLHPWGRVSLARWSCWGGR